jgi:hypothetical protein
MSAAATWSIEAKRQSSCAGFAFSRPAHEVQTGVFLSATRRQVLTSLLLFLTAPSPLPLPPALSFGSVPINAACGVARRV